MSQATCLKAPTLPSLDEFWAFCRTEARGAVRHGERYFTHRPWRAYETFQACAELVAPGAEVLSVGAGGAYVERALHEVLGARVTVVEFPAAIEAHAEHYARHGFRTVGADLSTPWHEATPGRFDLAVSFEVLEHLPVSPLAHFRSLAGKLQPGGHVVLTTPNLARLSNLVRLVRRQPIFGDATLAFEPTAYEREHVHRREYVASELEEAVRRAGLVHLRTRYLFNPGKHAGKAKTLAYRTLCGVFPRWKNVLLVTARKPG